MKKRKTYEVSVINKTYSKTYSDETKFYTSDTALELNFQLKEVEYDFDSAEIILLNVDDRSLVTRPVAKSAEGFAYELEDDIVAHYGEWKGQLKFNEGGEIYVSSPVVFRIENDLNNDRPPQLTDIRDWETLKQNAKDLIAEMGDVVANEAARIEAEKQRNETVKNIEARQNSVETQFNSIQQELTDKDVISAPEIIAARNGEANLKTRLDKEKQEVTTQLAQTDFVSQVSRLIGGYEKMYYKRENSIGWVSVMLLNKDEHITWTFRNNTFDDFYILGDCFAGSVTRNLSIYQNKNYETTTGTWVTSAPNAHYTAEVGATMTTYFDGEKIEFHHYADNRGGIWEFVLDDDTENKVTVSTWSETAIATNNKVLFEGLKFGTHKLVGTFKGDDPAHVPSSGAGTSRGWVYVNGLNNYLTYRSFKTQLINSRVQDIMVGFSNKEFAFGLRKSGSTQPYQFVPMHNSIGTAFEKEPVKFVADSTILSEADISNLTVGEFYECTKFSAIQSVYGRNPSNNSENLVEINTNVTISKDGNVEITGKFKPLTNVDIENGYAIMLPMSKLATTKVVTSKNNEYPTTRTDGSRTNLNAEGDTTKSLVSVSSENKDYISSLRFNDIKNTLRAGTKKGDVDMWIEHRDANMQKLYFRQFSNTTLTPSDIFKFSATINCAKVIDVYNLI